jgi:hypothetical protein
MEPQAEEVHVTVRREDAEWIRAWGETRWQDGAASATERWVWARLCQALTQALEHRPPPRPAG